MNSKPDAPELNLRIVGMGGEPAIGKTTIFKRLREHFAGVTREFKFGLVRGLADERMSTIIAGVYDGSTWEGCDKLSMAVQPDFEKMLTKLKDMACTVYFEGDRLFNPSLCTRFPVRGVVLKASEETLAARHASRHDDQPEQFLKAKRTKLSRIVEQFRFPTMGNDTRIEQDAVLAWLLAQHHTAP